MYPGMSQETVMAAVAERFYNVHEVSEDKRVRIRALNLSQS
jgi:hypothetical protein